MSTNWKRLMISLAVPALVACGSGDDDDDTAGSADAAAAATADAAPTGGDPDAAPTVGDPDAAPTGGDPDAASGALATLTGTITRSAAPQAGGVGTIYVAVFANNPVTDMSQTPIGRTLVADADMTASDAAVEYSIADLPPRGAPYHVVAFLDDNGTVDEADPSNAGPDTGDLMSMDGFAAPTVTLASGGPTTLDLDLNFAYPL